MAMRRLHQNLRHAGVDSRIMADQPDAEDPWTTIMPRWNALEKPLRRVTGFAGLNDIHRISSFSVPYRREIRQADVVHLHGTHTGFFNYLALPLLSHRKPVVFTLRDMWPLTGHCAVNHECDRWRTGCGACPYLDAHPAVRRDATKLEWRLKDLTYSASDLTIVALSTQFAEYARSGLLWRFPIQTIPNGVNIDTFFPIPRSAARAELGIRENDYVLICVVADFSQQHKGADLLLSALKRLPGSVTERTTLLLAGRGAVGLTTGLPVRFRSLGYLEDAAMLRKAYSAADITIIPSRSEALGNTALESLACATPVIAFAVGGLPDVVWDRRTGLLAKSDSAADLADKIVLLLQDPQLREYMATSCRAVAEENFSIHREVADYRSLYDELAT